jgi:hypothetical protein
MPSDPNATAMGTAVIQPDPSIRRRSTLRGLLRVLGPAWIVMLADVDAPSVLTAAEAGTDFGYAVLLPAIAPTPVLAEPIDADEGRSRSSFLAPQQALRRSSGRRLNI